MLLVVSMPNRFQIMAAEPDLDLLHQSIDDEVEKRRQVLSKLLDDCCLFYKQKYQNILKEALNSKSVSEIDFKRDIQAKVAPIAEKKVASQLRNAMRLETEFREVSEQSQPQANNATAEDQFDICTPDPVQVESGAIPKTFKSRNSVEREHVASSSRLASLGFRLREPLTVGIENPCEYT